MTDEHLIDWLHENFGGTKRTLRLRNNRWKQQWRWRVVGAEAVELYARLKPLLKIKNGYAVPDFHRPRKHQP